MRALLIALCTFAVTARSSALLAADPAATETLAKAGVFRHATVEQAWQTASAAHRPLVVMFTADGCPHCDRMLAETYANPAVRKLLAARSETALAHDSKYRALAGRLGVRAYPTTIVVSGEGKIVDAVEGFVEPAAFVARVSPWITPQAAAASPPQDGWTAASASNATGAAAR